MILDWFRRKPGPPRPPDDLNVGWSFGANAEGRWGVVTMVFVAEPPRPWSNRDLWILDDGTPRLSVAGAVCADWAELLAHVAAERVVATPPDGALVVLNGRSPISVSTVARVVPEWEVDAAGLAADLEDMRSAILGGPRALAGCRAAFRAYVDDPNERTRAQLRIAYRYVPPQMRPSILDNLEERDDTVRMLLRPDLTDAEVDSLIAYCRANFAHIR